MPLAANAVMANTLLRHAQLGRTQLVRRAPSAQKALSNSPLAPQTKTHNAKNVLSAPKALTQ